MIGATGAVGREIVNWANKEPQVTEMTLIVRKKLPGWENLDPKIKFVERENFDDLSDLASTLAGYDSFICTLGTRRKYGTDNFIKVDFQYPLNFANLAK